MTLADLQHVQNYFKNEEDRDPSMTEIRVLDTYWSDHCRHTTFLTTIDSVKFEDELLAKAYDEYVATRKTNLSQIRTNRCYRILYGTFRTSK